MKFAPTELYRIWKECFLLSPVTHETLDLSMLASKGMNRHAVYQAEMHLACQEIQLLQSNTIYCFCNTPNNKPGLHSPKSIS